MHKLLVTLTNDLSDVA